LLVVSGLVVMSELVFLLPVLILTSVFWRKSLEAVALAGPLARCCIREAGSASPQLRLRLALATDGLFVATTLVGVVFLVLKELSS
jgi:hypothetical protein